MSFSQSVPAYKHTSLDKPVGCQSTDIVYIKLANSTVFKNNSKAFWGCADWTPSLKTCDVAYSACFSGWSHLAPGRRLIGGRDWLTDWLNFYYTRIEVKAQMPVEQPVLDTNYKHLKIIRTLPKTTMIKTSITIAIIVAYTGENNIKYLREKANNQKTKQDGRGRRGWGDQSTKQLNRAFITRKHVIKQDWKS